MLINYLGMNYLETLIKKGLIGHDNLMKRDTVKVRGKEKKVKIFELKGMKHGEVYPE